jgi:hypothetical protein
MPGNGPPPKENRRRRNADTYADVRTRIKAEAITDTPSLAEVTCGLMDEFPPHAVELTERWWNTWGRSPLTAAWLETDWSRLAMIAPMVAQYYTHPHHLKLAEIRQNESLLGATHVDRLKARIKVEREEKTQEIPAGVAALDEYRSRLAG